MNKNDSGKLKNTFERIIGDLQTVVSIVYLLTVGIGMLFSYQRYSQFGINIFDYADIFDFLITPFSDFKVLGFSVLSIIFSISIIRIDVYIKKNKPIYYSKVNMGLDKKTWFESLRLILYTIVVIIYLFFTSKEYGKLVKKGIDNQNEIGVKFIDGESKSGILIGQTSEILFLKKNEKITAIPIKSMLKEIEIK